MRNLFNGNCVMCCRFGPSRVRLRRIRTSPLDKTYLDPVNVVCPECRKQIAGHYRLEPEHRPVPRPKKAPQKTLFDKERTT